MRAVDLFCGAGGLSQGLRQSGIAVSNGFDSNPDCAAAYTSLGGTFHQANLLDITAGDVMNALDNPAVQPAADAGYVVLAGGPPCQTFSTYNRAADASDPRFALPARFAQLVLDVRPDVLVMENVMGLARHQSLREVCGTLKSHGYHVAQHAVSYHKMGGPQTRKRLVVLASLHGLIDTLEPLPQHTPSTVRETIGHLPPIKAGEPNHVDPLHAAAELNALNIERITHSAPGGTWRDWPSHLRLTCHTRASGSTYPSVYGRAEWDRPAPTITTQFYAYGSGRFGHPEQSRAFTLREGALLQGFPEHTAFARPGANFSRGRIGRLIGNAVPVPLAQALGATIVKHLTQRTHNA